MLESVAAASAARGNGSGSSARPRPTSVIRASRAGCPRCPRAGVKSAPARSGRAGLRQSQRFPETLQTRPEREGRKSRFPTCAPRLLLAVSRALLRPQRWPRSTATARRCTTSVALAFRPRSGRAVRGQAALDSGPVALARPPARGRRGCVDSSPHRPLIRADGVATNGPRWGSAPNCTSLGLAKDRALTPIRRSG